MRFIQADTVYPIHTAPVKNGIVVINENHIVEVLHSTEGIDTTQIERHEGILCPGFINTHCHLELSHLAGKIPEKKGLIQFAKEVIGQRGAASAEQIQIAMEKADRAMQANGIVAVGDISNVADSFGVKVKSKIYYHTFIELIGLNPTNAEKIMQSGNALLEKAKEQHIPASLVPHAPYSTSYLVMKGIADQSKQSKNPLSIHNQESQEENLLFENKTGAYLDLYRHLNLPIDHFEATGKSSLKSYLPFMQQSHSLLLVHNTFSSAEDLSFSNSTHNNLYWCLCPNANLYIEDRLPDVPAMMQAGCRLTIGTDSLASNHHLSIADELAVLKSHFPVIETQELLTWATLNGASFLGVGSQYGSFEKGKEPGLVLLDEATLRLKKVLA